MKKIIVLLIAILSVSLVFGVAYQQDYPTSDRSAPAEAQFAVTALKYEPYPVNPGEYFDLWVKAENIGNTDALSAKFELVPKYPFSSSDNLVREYGKVSGNTGKTDENNQVVMKFRVKVADDAPSGLNDIDFKASSGNIGADFITKTLQVDVEKTRTDFDVVMQDVAPQGTSFIITNTGDNSASAITVDVEKQDGILFLEGAQPAVISSLDKGEFTIAHMDVIPNKGVSSMKLKISYTDTGGSRTTVEKTVSVQIGTTIDQICQQNTGKSYIPWVYGVVGFLVGLLLIVAVVMARRKK